MTDQEDIDGLVRRTDPDRWLASRFAPEGPGRAALLALYAFNHELAHAAEAASQPLIGEMRIAWWREAVEELFDGKPPRAHPAVKALEAAVRSGALGREVLDGMAEGRLRDLDGWPLQPAEVDCYIDATAGRLMAAAAGALSADADPRLIRGAARAWGLAGLSRMGRLPRDWPAEEVRHRVDAALADARSELKRLPVAAFPAVAYAALARSYAAGKPVSDLGKRLRVTLAVARGRI